MRALSILWILLIVTTAHLEGVLGLFYSSKPSVLIPSTVAVNSPLLYLYAYQEPTLQTVNQPHHPPITCDIFSTTQDGITLPQESSPFSVNSSGMYLYATKSLETVLSEAQSNTTKFLLTVDCSSITSRAVLSGINITIISFDAWYSINCAAPSELEPRQFDAQSFCFGERINEFDVYENMHDVELGELSGSRGPVECPSSSTLRKTYELNTQETQFTIQHNKLYLHRALDREKTSKVTLSVTCRVPGLPGIRLASREFSVHVGDIHDCGPVLRVNVENTPTNVTVINFTLEPGKEGKKQPIISDCDRPTAVTDYQVTVTGDPEHVLQVSDVQTSFSRKKIVISAREAPDKDFNATIKVRDRTVVSSRAEDSQILFHVFMKGGNTASPSGGADENPVSTGTEGSVKDNKVENITVADPTSGDRPISQTGTDEIIIDPAYKPELGPPYNQRPDVTHTTTQWRPAATGKVSTHDGHGYHFSKEYKKHLNISAAAANYTTLEELFKITSGNFQYRFRQSSSANPFSISGDIVYVANSLREYGGRNLSLDIEAINAENKFNVLVSIHIDVLPSSLGVSNDCDRSCATATTEEECSEMCGYGAPSGRCTWMVAPRNAHYSTCVGDPERCPDERCNNYMEGVILDLCPQDCSNGKKGISTGEIGTCHCPTADDCDCYRSTPKIAESSSDVTKEVSSGCDKNCRLVLSLSLVGGCIVTSCFVILVWHCRSRMRKGSMKHVSSIVSITVPSDYVDDNDRPSGILPNADWNPLYIDARFKVDGDWEFPRRNLVLDKTLGEGEFGRVVRATATDIQGQKGTQTVAVKMLKECASSAEMRDLISEYTLLKDVSHKNVIKLLGVCSQKGPFYIIVEYCEHGALRNYLRRSRQACYISNDVTAGTDDANPLDRKIPRHDDTNVTAKDLLSFAWQTAKGMQYLCEMKLVHRDLAARNILIAAGKVIKISDFGLTRDIYEGDAYLKRSKGRIPVKWMAPESLYDQVYTSKSDVWSFGVVLWEIVTLGATPYPGVPPERLYQMLKTGYRMDRPQGCSDDLFQIMKRCWREDPAQRHSFKYIASQFEAMLSASTSYLDLTYQSERPLAIEDETTEVAPVSQDASKTNSTVGEPEYGSINILSTDINSYVITPTLQANTDVFNNWSRDDNQSTDSATEETQFLQSLSDQNNKNISGCRLLGTADNSETQVLENGV